YNIKTFFSIISCLSQINNQILLSVSINIIPIMTRLSVNINKIATLRNARGGKSPDLLKMAIDAEAFGAQGITVHPRPDERHITYQDVLNLKPLVTTEFNIEGNPTEQKFVALVLKTRPH